MNSDKTKKLLAASMMELAKTTPINKITIQQITSNCDLSKQTFYNHFIDKEDLVKWFFTSVHEDVLEEMNDFRKFTDKSTAFSVEHWNFYEKLERDGTCWTWYSPWISENICKFIAKNYGKSNLTPELTDIINIWSSGSRYRYRELLQNGQISKDDSMAFAERVCANMPTSLKRYLIPEDVSAELRPKRL